MTALIRRVAWLVAIGLVLAAAPVQATAVEERFDLEVVVRHPDHGEVRRTVPITVFRDPARTRSPFLILNHGRATTPAANAALGRVRYSENARHFVDRGFAVFVPTRIGYGIAGGPDLESSGPCGRRNFPPAYDAAAQTVRQVIAHVRTRADVDPDRGLVVGQSFGGVTAIAIAATPPAGVRAVVNFAGGGGGRPATHPGRPCSPEAMEALFADYGARARMPTLWLYAENDLYFGARLPRVWFDAFVAAGGRGRFVALPPHGEDGHGSFTRNPEAWRPAFEAFLAETGFAVATRR